MGFPAPTITLFFRKRKACTVAALSVSGKLEQSTATGPALQPSISKQNQEMTRHSVYAMSGVPSREEYARMLKEKGLEAVEEGAFQKCFDLDYPYWSAPTVTLALVSLALSKAEALRL